MCFIREKALYITPKENDFKTLQNFQVNVILYLSFILIINGKLTLKLLK